MYDIIKNFIRKLLLKETNHSKEKIDGIRITFKFAEIPKQTGSIECGYICILLFLQLLMNEWDYKYLEYDNRKNKQSQLLEEVWPYFVNFTMKQIKKN